MEQKYSFKIRSKSIYLFLLACFSIFFFSCNPTKFVPENKYLLRKNKIENCPKDIVKEELYLLLKQKPNRKILFTVRFHLGAYNLGNTLAKKDAKKGIWFWLKNTIGEEPVVINNQKTQIGREQIEKYLYNKGFFNVKVMDSLMVDGVRKASVFYQVISGLPYVIKGISYSITDSLIREIILSDTLNCLVKINNRFDSDLLDQERNRLSKLLKNKGYYGFPKELVTYKIDSSLKNQSVNLEVIVKNSILQFDSIQNKFVSTQLERYYIKDVFVNTDYIPLQKDTIPFDTLAYKQYSFLFKKKLHYNPRSLTQSIFIRNNDLFNMDRSEQTYKKLSDLRAFRFININYFPIVDSNDFRLDKCRPLSCNLLLTPVQRQSYQLELNGTNTKDNLGTEGSLMYQHSNLFKGFEQLSIRLKGALEFQYTNVPEKDANDKNFNPFNTYEYGGDISLKVPKFLIPVKQERFPKTMFPKTIFSAGFNYQFRSDYNRIISNITLGYQWNEGKYKTHLFDPVEFNIVQIDKDSAFTQRLLNYGNLNTISSFQSHLISAAKYSFTFNNQNRQNRRHYVYFRGSLEWSGNIFRALSPLLDFKQKVDGSYTLFDIRYSQYIRPDFDFRFYKIINKSSSIATRLATGLGYAYGNDQSLPFEKSFNIGGPNSIRAWRPMSLGLGSYNESSLTTKIGDMSIEYNFEYRFDLYKYLKGALFMDAGNIWALKNDPTRPGAEFKVSEFYKQLALGGGIGFRFDFSFFIIRVDLAAKLHNPANEEGSRWVIKEYRPKYTIFNLGIGYPF